MLMKGHNQEISKKFVSAGSVDKIRNG